MIASARPRQQKPQIWLIGGTQESAILAQQLILAGLLPIVSVTTAQAQHLYPLLCKVWVGTLTWEQMPGFLYAHAIGAVLDASHPFAVEVSQGAIAATRQQGIPYLRYERGSLASSAIPQPIGNHSCNPVQTFASIATLLASGVLEHQRVLLVLGYRALPLFESWQDRATLFARILPSLTALETALASGFRADRLIALRPPITPELEQALWQQWQISWVVAKASGIAGGEAVKRTIAAELGVSLALIQRPTVAYPHQTSDVAAAIAWCQQVLSL
jgi:precorrin-6A/cobalt-precorrin-6A reductase